MSLTNVNAVKSVFLATQILVISNSLLASDKEHIPSLDQELIVACYRADLDGVISALQRGANVNARFGEAGNKALFGAGSDDGRRPWPAGAENMNALLALASAARWYPPRGQQAVSGQFTKPVLTRLDETERETQDQTIWAIGVALLSHGCDLEARNGVGRDRGLTAICMALENRHRRLSELLIKHGAEVEMDDDWDAFPLHFAAWSPELTNLILDRGADPRRRDAHGMNPADHARRHARLHAGFDGNPEVVKIYDELGVRPNARPIDPEPPKVQRYHEVPGSLPPRQPWISPTTGMHFVWIEALQCWVGKYEVTNGEYRQKERKHDSGFYDGHSLNTDRQPVVKVRFADAKAYAAWLTQQDGLQIDDLRYRLPSEQEFLTYARCGDGREYPWGNEWPPKYGNYHGQEGVAAWTKIAGYDDGYPVTCSVEMSGRNDRGLYGVGGNVWEACAEDTSVDQSFGAFCGASWQSGRPTSLRCDYRGLVYDGSISFVSSGFRLVLSR